MRYEGLCYKTVSAGPGDPLDTLNGRDRLRLAYEARAQLARVVPAATRRLLERGRCFQMVERRMRWLLDLEGRE